MHIIILLNIPYLLLVQERNSSLALVFMFYVQNKALYAQVEINESTT